MTIIAIESAKTPSQAKIVAHRTVGGPFLMFRIQSENESHFIVQGMDSRGLYLTVSVSK